VDVERVSIVSFDVAPFFVNCAKICCRGSRETGVRVEGLKIARDKKINNSSSRRVANSVGASEYRTKYLKRDAESPNSAFRFQ